MTDTWASGTGYWGTSGVANSSWSDDLPPAQGESVQIGSSSSHPTVIIDNGILAYAGTAIANFGEISIDAHAQGENYVTGLDISGATVLSDGGSVVMGASAQSLGDFIFSSVSSSALDNVDNTISGTGEIGVIGGDGSVLMGLTNGANGVINGTGSTSYLLIDGLNATTYMTLANSGLIEATGSYASSITNGALEINYATISQSGGGTIAGAGGIVTLADTTVAGGNLSSTGSGFIAPDYATFDGTSSAVTITSGSTVEIANGGKLTLAATNGAGGSIVNHGTIDMASGGYTSQLAIGSGAGGTVTLSGGGNVTLTGDIVGGATGTALVNVDNTIAGLGSIGFSGAGTPAMSFTNEATGVVDATGASVSLLIEGNSGNSQQGMTVTNDGLMEATGTDANGLQIDYAIINQSGGGTLDGAGGNVTLNASTVVGGTLKTTGAGLVEALSSATLDGTTSPVTITSGSTFEISDGGKLILAAQSGATGSIVNHGVIDMASGGNVTELAIGSGATGGVVALSGGGKVTINSLVVGGAANAVLDNVDNTIEGIGSIGFSGAGTPAMSLENGTAGVIEASGATSSTLTLNTGATIANNGALEANVATLIVDDSVSGSGHATIANGGVIDFKASFQENAVFQGADAGTLSLSQAYAGTISGIQTGDIIDLADLTYASGDHLALQSVQNGVDAFAVENSNGTVLTTLNFAGEYKASDFSPSTDSGGHLRFTVTSTTPPPVPSDFTGSGVSDVLLRNGSGSFVDWTMNGPAVTASTSLTAGGAAVALSSAWTVDGVGDLNSDGKADILLRNSNGTFADWTMNGSQITTSQLLTSQGATVTLGSAWTVDGLGDFNGDGDADVLLRNTNGTLADWTMNGSQIASSQLLSSQGATVTLGSAWSVAGVGDFNGDGLADILLRNSNGAFADWTMNGSKIASSQLLTSGGATVTLGAAWSVAGVGDFNGDGLADVLLRNSNGTLADWTMNGSQIESSQLLTSGGKTVTLDPSWSIAALGDFTGDGKTDILLQNTSGAFVEWTMNGSTITAATAVTAAGKPVSTSAWHAQGSPTDLPFG